MSQPANKLVFKDDLPDSRRQCDLWVLRKQNRLDRQIRLDSHAQDYGALSYGGLSDDESVISPDLVFRCYLRVNRALMQCYPSREFFAVERFLYHRHCDTPQEPRELKGLVWEERRRILAKAGLSPEKSMKNVYETLDRLKD